LHSKELETGGFHSSFLSYCRKRRGAINAKQLAYLERYKPTKLLKERESGGNCVVQ
jgi:hypothetical protein